MLSHNFLIRPAVMDDIDVLQKLSADTFIETYAAYNTDEDMRLHVSEQFNPEQMMDELSSKENYFFIAFYEGEPAGYIKLRTAKQPPQLEGLKHIELERIYALKQFQGTGLGKLLIQQCVVTVNENNYEILWLGVWKQNEKAIQFYTKCGFTIFGEQVFTLGTDDQSDWLMKRELIH